MGFPTQTGRVELYSYAYARFGEDPLPYFEPPAYSPDTLPELMKKDYPFILTTGARRQEFFHSEHHQVPSLRQITPWPVLDINPADAEKLGIEDGDWCEISSPYGHVRQKANVTATIKPGVVHAMHGTPRKRVPSRISTATGSPTSTCLCRTASMQRAASATPSRAWFATS